MTRSKERSLRKTLRLHNIDKKYQPAVNFVLVAGGLYLLAKILQSKTGLNPDAPIIPPKYGKI